LVSSHLPATHRTLPSLPTRRSSDLEPVDLHFSLTPAPTRLLPGDTLRFDIGSRTDLLRSSPSEGWVHFDLPVPPYLSRNTVHFGDRKSTRLNSSHVKISYAVFCLKK